MHSTTTSSMKRHIKRKHPLHYNNEYNGIPLNVDSKDTKNKDGTEENAKENSFCGKNIEGDIICESVQIMDFSGDDGSSYEPSESEGEIDCELDSKIKELCNKPALWCVVWKNDRKYVRKTCIWNFFKSVKGDSDNVYECMFCLTHISVFGRKLSNLKRHMKKRHSVEYYRILKYAPKSDSLHDQAVSSSTRNAKTKAECETTNVDNYRDIEHAIQIGDLVIGSKKDLELDGHNDEELEMKVKDVCNKPVLGKVKGKTCIWNFFQHVSGDAIYKCTICTKDIKIFPKSVANLTRHLKHRHPEILSKIYKHAPSDDSLFKRKASVEKEDEAEFMERLKKSRKKLDDDTIEMIKKLCRKSVSGKVANKTCIWNFFESVSPTAYKCMFCKTKIAVSLGSAGNCRRHISKIHPKEYEVIIQYAPENDSLHRAGSSIVFKHLSRSVSPTSVEFDKAYFDDVGDGRFVCKQCDETVECNDEDQSMLFSHIQTKHPDQVVMYQEKNTENEEFSVFIIKK